MTPLQHKALTFITDHVEVTGYSPSYSEIATALGRSPSQTHAVINALAAKNHIVKTGSGERNIEIVGAGLQQIPSAALLAELMRRELNKGAAA